MCHEGYGSDFSPFISDSKRGSGGRYVRNKSSRRKFHSPSLDMHLDSQCCKFGFGSGLSDAEERYDRPRAQWSVARSIPSHLTLCARKTGEISKRSGNALTAVEFATKFKPRAGPGLPIQAD